MAPPRPLIRDMDALPTPDYDDYFEALRASTLSTLIRPGLLAESSRGCWWGEKSHCTFCGLNGTGMKYRSKSPERVLTELAELSRRYGVNGIQFVDNILDMSYFRTMLPRLAAEGGRYALFYETKANLKREQVKLLAEAGVRWIQPGIESLDDNVLRLIGKGNSTLDQPPAPEVVQRVRHQRGLEHAQRNSRRIGQLVRGDGRVASRDLPSAAALRRESSPLRPLQPLSHARAGLRSHARAESGLCVRVSLADESR